MQTLCRSKDTLLAVLRCSIACDGLESENIGQLFRTASEGLESEEEHESRGDVDYARRIAALSPTLDVFPSNEANLLLARGGPFAGCISATANINSADCARAYKDGDAIALARAVAIRSICDGLPLVPAVKSMVVYLEDDEAYARVMPPFLPLAETDRSLVIQRYHAVQGAASGATSRVH
jgi:dihydrodipicolinate synthase/N-acetylneuraminate lyase